MTEYQLGDRVRFTHELRRVGRYQSGSSERLGGEVKVWSPSKAPEGTGIITGRRALSNGETQWNYDGPTVYTATETIVAYVVTWHLYRKPVLVLPEHLSRIEAS
jgi:hypothetical protein